MKIKYKTRLRKGFSLVELLVVIAIIAGLAAMSYGPIMKQVKAAAKTTAINNGKQIYTALFSFASDNNGIFPNENTGDDGDTAEACFTQLLDAGKIDEEVSFWNKENSVLGVVDGTGPPDEDGILTSGENAWGYVSGLNTSSRTNIPLIFDSVAGEGSFDTAVWEGQAIVVKINGSSQAMQIEYDGPAVDSSGDSQQGAIEENENNIFDRVDNIDSAEVLLPGG
ncbi:MAG: prepilin-type N-terminal cleavage/methylation domain-containing protein [Crocinitomicaceae bacterium]|jgi:prepilin-type N-terminal cleavage/methylation domain-containing protein